VRALLFLPDAIQLNVKPLEPNPTPYLGRV